MKNYLTILILIVFRVNFIDLVNLKCNFDIVKSTENNHGLTSYIEKNHRYEDFFTRFTLYRCTAQNLTVTTRDEVIENISGNHLANLTNRNVNWLTIKNSIVNYLPNGTINFFPSISILYINSIHLMELTMEDLKQFPRLKMIWAANNELVELQPNLFSRHVIISVMDFSNNKLKYVDKNSLIKRSTDYANFRNNDCFDKEIDFSPDYPAASKFHSSCLFPNEIFVRYDKLNLSFTAVIEDGAEYDGIKITKIRFVQKRWFELRRANVLTSKLTASALNFTKIPQIICDEFKALEELEMTGCLIVKISKEELKKFPRLKVLKMPLNRIKSITSDTFLYNENLELIDLSYNKIESIGLGLFSSLKNLQTILLQNTGCGKNDGIIRLEDEIINKNSSSFNMIIMNIKPKCWYDDVILCKFSTSTFRYIGTAYYCNIVKRKIKPDDDIISYFKSAFWSSDFSKLHRLDKFNGAYGEHLEGKSNKDVEVLTVKYEESRIIDRNLSFYLPNLRTIRVTHSNLRYLYESVFNGLTNLTVIDFSHNKLTEVPKKIFDENPNMIFVNFSYNNLKRLSMDVFNEFLKIKFIKLFGNPCISSKFESLDVKELQSLVNKCTKRELELFCNDYNDFTNDFCIVTYIDQSSELLPIVKVHKILDGTTVHDFIIDYAAIEYLPTNISKFFPNIKIFNAYGIIKHIFKENFEKLSELERVDLSNNKIETIAENVFEDNKKLYQLFLNFNRIKHFHTNSLKNLKMLDFLELKGNICADNYFQRLDPVVSQRRLQMIIELCGALLPGCFKKVEKSMNTGD